MSSTPYVYSPRPPSNYYISVLDQCEARFIDTLEDRQASAAAWNLFWLSVPEIDTLVLHGANHTWNRHYQPVPNAMSAVMADVVGDDPLRLKLLLHPVRFIEFFNHQDHSIFDCYTKLGGYRWVDTVLLRANQAAARIGAWSPDWSHGVANVYSISGKPHDPIRDGSEILQLSGTDKPPPSSA